MPFTKHIMLCDAVIVLNDVQVQKLTLGTHIGHEILKIALHFVFNISFIKYLIQNTQKFETFTKNSV